MFVDIDLEEFTQRKEIRLLAYQNILTWIESGEVITVSGVTGVDMY